MKKPITDEELAKELFEIAEKSGMGLLPWDSTTNRASFESIARRARELLQSSWPDPIPIVTGEEPTYPCLLFARKFEAWQPWDSKPRFPNEFSHYIPMPPAPVVDPFEVEWKSWLDDGKGIGSGKENARHFWQAALKSKEGK